MAYVVGFIFSVFILDLITTARRCARQGGRRFWNQ